MGNYFAHLPYMGYQGNNNNMMNANDVVHVSEHRVPKLSSFLNDVDTVSAVNQLQYECKKDSSVMMNLWNKLYFYISPLAPSATNLVERSSQIISSKDRQNISANKGSWNKESETELDFLLKPQRSSKDCLKYVRQIRPVVTNILEENSLITFLQQTCKPSWEKCEAESDSSCLLNTEQYQETEASSYVDQCQKRPPTSFSFQRLDSGIEDLPYPRGTRCQIDLNCERNLIDSCSEDSFRHYKTLSQIDSDSLYISTMIRTFAKQASCLSEDRMADAGCKLECYKPISFFIDIRNPLEQKPLGEKYKFLFCDDCDSMFSDQCSDEDCSDDDFIFFHGSGNEETDGCGFNFTLNACTPTELSCSVSANSTSCFDVAMDTSAHQNPRNEESSVSVKIGVRLSGAGTKTCESPEYNSCDVNECIDFNDLSSFDFASEITRTNGLETFTSSFTVGNHLSRIDDNEFTPVEPTHTSEGTDKTIPRNLKTTFCDTYNKEKKKCRKKVCFQKDEDLVEVHQMIHWDFAYREARKGTWELEAVDRCRFMRRVNELELILSPCLRRKLEVIQTV